MKITVEVPIANAEDEVLGFELDTATREIGGALPPRDPTVPSS